MNPSGTERTRRRVSMSDWRWAIILHGGAKEIAPEEQEAHREGVRAALTAGIAVLQRGGAAGEAGEGALPGVGGKPTFQPRPRAPPEFPRGVRKGAGVV